MGKKCWDWSIGPTSPSSAIAAVTTGSPPPSYPMHPTHVVHSTSSYNSMRPYWFYPSSLHNINPKQGRKRFHYFKDSRFFWITIDFFQNSCSNFLRLIIWSSDHPLIFFVVIILQPLYEPHFLKGPKILYRTDGVTLCLSSFQLRIISSFEPNYCENILSLAYYNREADKDCDWLYEKRKTVFKREAKTVGCCDIIWWCITSLNFELLDMIVVN